MGKAALASSSSLEECRWWAVTCTEEKPQMDSSGPMGHLFLLSPPLGAASITFPQLHHHPRFKMTEDQTVSPNPPCFFGWLPPESPPRSSPSDLCNLPEDLQGSRGRRAQRPHAGDSEGVGASGRPESEWLHGCGVAQWHLLLGRKREREGDKREGGWPSSAQRCQCSAAIWAPRFKL